MNRTGDSVASSPMAQRFVPLLLATGMGLYFSLQARGAEPRFEPLAVAWVEAKRAASFSGEYHN